MNDLKTNSYFNIYIMELKQFEILLSFEIITIDKRTWNIERKLKWLTSVFNPTSHPLPST